MDLLGMKLNKTIYKPFNPMNNIKESEKAIKLIDKYV